MQLGLNIKDKKSQQVLGMHLKYVCETRHGIRCKLFFGWDKHTYNLILYRLYFIVL